MQSTIHNPSQLNQFEPHFRGVTDAVESESIPEVACCRTLVQRSYSTHSVVIPKNPVLIADADGTRSLGNGHGICSKHGIAANRF